MNSGVRKASVRSSIIFLALVVLSTQFMASVVEPRIVYAVGDITMTGRLLTSGSNSTYGAITIQGAKAGYSGINFRDGAGAIQKTLMVSPTYSGIYNSADNAWDWYFTDGTLTAGTIPAANVSAGTLGGSFTFSSAVTVGTPTASGHAATKSYVDSAITTGITGTSGYVPKFTATSTLGNSLIYDNGTNIGIGSASPGFKLDVVGTAKTTGTSTLATASGNVGIGSATPAYKLDVNGTARITGALTLGTTLTVPNGGTGATTLTGVVKGNGASAFTAMTGTQNYLTKWSDANTVAASTVIYDNGTNIGIASTSPGYKLDVVGTMRISATSTFSGNVGIGTTLPTMKLAIIGADNTPTTPVAVAYSNNGLAYAALTFQGIRSSGGPISFYSNGTTEHMTVATTGNVGIGSASPTFKLDVNGTLNAATSYNLAGGAAVIYLGGGFLEHYYAGGNSFSYWNGSTVVTGMVLNNSGNVGIGSVTPSARLDVGGGKISNVATPTASSDAATKGYVDSKSSPSGWTCTIRSASGTSVAASVSCSGNERLITGGCNVSGYYIQGSAPSGQGWTCSTDGGWPSAVAQCCI